MAPPFRAEHMGSLLHPKALMAARKAVLDDKTGSEADLKAAEDRAIKDIVALQLDIGLRGVNDGEYRRLLFVGKFFVGLEGFEDIPNMPIEIFRTFLPDTADYIKWGEPINDITICTGKIKHVGSKYIDEFNYLKNLVPKGQENQVKLTIVSPYWYHYRYKPGKAYPLDVYKNDEEYFADIIKAYTAEMEILYKNGCRNLQIDDPYLTFLSGFRADREDPDSLLDRYINLYNDILAGRPSDLHVGVHLCRGNFIGSRHFTEGSYDKITTKLFNELNVDTYYLEYDTPRAGGFEPLKDLPKNKNAILGVVTSKFPELEDIDEMRKRTREEALQRLGVSPQCGFASHVLGNAVTEEDMIAKLKLVRRLADEIWPGEV
ncbi:UROD/MetE-like protein [Cadophora sp. DSE1049]|nr:UROD/MetE-like protein [Cadophora sp. DSE1049]